MVGRVCVVWLVVGGSGGCEVAGVWLCDLPIEMVVLVSGCC